MHVVDCTYNSSRLCGFDERQCTVIRFFRDVNKAFFQLALLQETVQLIQEADPLVSFLIAVSQDQDGAFLIAGSGKLWCCHLQERKRRTTSKCITFIFLKLQYKTNVNNTNTKNTHPKNTGNVLPVRMNDIWRQNWANRKFFIPETKRERDLDIKQTSH